MIKNADFHIHSKYAMASSPEMTPENILAGCKTKGIDVVASGDALHPEWRKSWMPYAENDEIIVVPQTEVEDSSRVHHVILAESFELFDELEKEFEPACSHIATAGRPHISLDGEEIAAAVHDLGGLIGPAHAFTPWTSLFASYDKPSECYGEEKPDFCELGLSADSSYGAGIEEFKDIPFLSNSDAHSCYPTKLGREFNKIEIKQNSVKGVLDALLSGSVVLNVGFFPEEGKYNRTACTRCYAQFTLEQAEELKWKCPHDKGRIKLGVRERAQKLSTGVQTPRPPYVKIIPLGEIIARVLNVSSPNTKKCTAVYNEYIKMFDNEINVLLNVSEEELSFVSEDVARAVVSMRAGNVKLQPGGGGKYGSFRFE